MKPFYKAQHIPKTDVQIAEIAKATNHSIDEVKEQLAEVLKYPIYKNNKYQVQIRRISGSPWITADLNGSPPDIIHLSIKRLDRETIHDWRELQQIKNMLVGPEYEAVELYPAESRLVDSSNQYHLWAVDSKEFVFPFGFFERFVTDIETSQTKNRKFDKDDE